MIDRAQTLEPDSRTPLSEKVLKEVTPVVIEAACMFIISQALGPLSSPDIANTITNQLVLYTAGLGSGLLVDLKLHPERRTKISLAKSLIAALSTSYLIHNPDSNVVTETLKNMENTISQAVNTKHDTVAQAVTATPTNIPPTIFPTEVAPTLAPTATTSAEVVKQTVAGMPDFSNIVILAATLGIGTVAVTGIGLGINRVRKNLAPKFEQLKTNVGEAVKLSKEFFSKLSNVGEQSPETMLDNVSQLTDLVEKMRTEYQEMEYPLQHNYSTHEIRGMVYELSEAIKDLRQLESDIRADNGMPASKNRSRIG